MRSGFCVRSAANTKLRSNLVPVYNLVIRLLLLFVGAIVNLAFLDVLSGWRLLLGIVLRLFLVFVTHITSSLIAIKITRSPEIHAAIAISLYACSRFCAFLSITTLSFSVVST